MEHLIAKAKQVFKGSAAFDPFYEVLPDREIEETEIKVEWADSPLRVSGMVKPGMPNALFHKAMPLTPAYFRRGAAASEEAAEVMARQARMMFKVMKAQTLTGGIDLMDPDTGVTFKTTQDIPLENLWLSTPDRIAEEAGRALLRLKDKTLAKTYYVFANSCWISKLESLREHATVVFIEETYMEGNTERHLWPKDKISVVASDLEFMLGANYLTIGESPEQKPGFWVRLTESYKDIKYTTQFLPPSLIPEDAEKETYLQVGASGLPILKRPHQIIVINIR